MSLVFKIWTPESAGLPEGCSLHFSRFLVAMVKNSIKKNKKKVKKLKKARSWSQPDPAQPESALQGFWDLALLNVFWILFSIVFLKFLKFFNFYIEFSRPGHQKTREMKTTACWKPSWLWGSDLEDERNEDCRLQSQPESARILEPARARFRPVRPDSVSQDSGI